MPPEKFPVTRLVYRGFVHDAVTPLREEGGGQRDRSALCDLRDKRFLVERRVRMLGDYALNRIQLGIVGNSLRGIEYVAGHPLAMLMLQFHLQDVITKPGMLPVRRDNSKVPI
ncbi:hypothetical protein D3C73_1333430 [compost metagenome]